MKGYCEGPNVIHANVATTDNYVVQLLPLMRTVPSQAVPDKQLESWYSLCAQSGLLTSM